MDTLFGDSTMITGTLTVGQERVSLMRSGSPSESVDSETQSQLKPSNPVRHGVVDPSDSEDGETGKTRAHSGKMGIGNWISGLVGRAKGSDRRSGGKAGYTALQQGED
jgi:hypothetical protein